MNTPAQQTGPAAPDPGSARLPAKPAWFETTFTQWDFPEEIPCAKKVPRDAIFVGTTMWAFAPGMDRVDQYRLSTNRGRKHLILWVGARNESGSGWTFVPIAYGPAKSPSGESMHEWHAALHLLAAAWKAEKDQTGEFEPPQEVSGLLFGEDFEAVGYEVWPEYRPPNT